MNNTDSKRADILKLIEGLDISATMYENANKKYKAVATYLQGQGLVCDIFPQGSFSLGTVVRPYKGSETAAYDLDFICCLDEIKENTTAKYVKNVVKDTLCESEVYRQKLQDTEWDKCWTLEYADINGIGFNIDIVPAVPESDEVIRFMEVCGLTNEVADQAVAITNKKYQNYSWCTSNPRAYKQWFEEINRPFLEYDRQNRRRVIFEKNVAIYNSVEEIPEGLERSSLQRVIQILKHHRDVYYSRILREDFKPTSAIITTICAEIARCKVPTMDVFGLLQEIVEEFEIYSKNHTLAEEEFSRIYQNKNVIRKKNEKWCIINPVNPTDNLADSWNEVPEKAKLFFEWVKAVKRDYLERIYATDNDFVATIENNFGRDYVRKSIDLGKYNCIIPEAIVSTPKPWGI